MTNTATRNQSRRAATRIRRAELINWLARIYGYLIESYCTLEEAAAYAREDGYKWATPRRVALANAEYRRDARSNGIAAWRPTRPAKDDDLLLTGPQWERVTRAIYDYKRNHILTADLTVAGLSLAIKRLSKVNRPLKVIERAAKDCGLWIPTRKPRPIFKR